MVHPGNGVMIKCRTGKDNVEKIYQTSRIRSESIE